MYVYDVDIEYVLNIRAVSVVGFTNGVMLVFSTNNKIVVLHYEYFVFPLYLFIVIFDGLGRSLLIGVICNQPLP
jgi:hypothetical protein